MVKTKPVDVVVDKWRRRAEVASDDYKTGIQNPRRAWSEGSLAAKEAWKAGVSAAITRDAFAKGVSAAGDEKWRKAALSKGVTRYSEGVRLASEEYRKKIQEVLSVIEGVTLPPRGPRGDPKNIERVRAIADALHKYRTSKA